MAKDTREQLLDTAEALFAERGFYGVSIAAIADELGLTKQALLHHFSTKEKLYGEVLRRISEDYEARLSDAGPGGLKPALQYLASAVSEDTARARLLMRELLDNKRRADAAGVWYLTGFLETLIKRLQSEAAWKGAPKAEALAAIYQLLGAINYYAVSGPTLTGIFGPKIIKQTSADFAPSLERLIDAVVARA